MRPDAANQIAALTSRIESLERSLRQIPSRPAAKQQPRIAIYYTGGNTGLVKGQAIDLVTGQGASTANPENAIGVIEAVISPGNFLVVIWGYCRARIGNTNLWQTAYTTATAGVTTTTQGAINNQRAVGMCIENTIFGVGAISLIFGPSRDQAADRFMTTTYVTGAGPFKLTAGNSFPSWI